MTNNLPPGLRQLNKCLNMFSGNLRNLFSDLFSDTTRNRPGPGRKKQPHKLQARRQRGEGGL